MNSVFSNDRPIYLQIMDELKLEIISGKLPPKEKLPSVRDLSNSLKVNPNTVQKALAELEREGLIFTERTNGKYVTDNDKVISKIREEVISKKVKDFYEDMSILGIKEQELVKYINERR